jgi:type IV pilus assembly protein PilY1
MTMKSKQRLSASILSALSLLGAASTVHAQAAGTQKNELPNVLLLVDTSGSMERMTNGAMPVCNPGVETQPNRWGSLIQAMTGSVQPYYSCVAQPRSGPEFTNEFTFGGSSPIDLNYFLPHHRVLSSTGPLASCAVTHNAAGALINQTLNPSTFAFSSACTFDQAQDGQLDMAKDLIRLGLMTFDTQLESADTMTGAWSYYLGAPRQGQPPLCGTASPYEVGARSTNAPEWEGPQIRFPLPSASLLDVRANNERIQRALTALRPYGGTPIDAMLDDAKQYLWNDPNGPNATSGPTKDPSIAGNCREQFIILLTDGAPNMNMRTACEGGTCPYPNRAKDTAAELLLGATGPKTTTFVVGFSINDTGPASFPGAASTCKQWYKNETNALATPTAKAAAFATACTTLNPAATTAAAACCTLNELSVNGNGGPAFFAESQADLASAMGEILGRIAKGQTTRTTPAYSGVSGTSSESATFLASFNPSPDPRVPWNGNVSRERLKCETTGANAGQRVVAPADATKGDDFSATLSKQTTDDKRRALLVLPAEVAGKVDPELSLRPFQPGTPTDFTAEFSTQKFGPASISTAFTGFYDDRPFQVPASWCKKSLDFNNTPIPPLGSLDCAKAAFGFAFGLTNGMLLGAPSYDFSRQRYNWVTGKYQPFGAIFHANPVFMGPPVAPLRDESYQSYATAYKSRPRTVFVTTIDGLLHAFKADEEDPINKAYTEMWAFLPPAVMGNLKSNVPRGNQILLDGQPVVREVIFDRTRAETSPAALTAADAGKKWHGVIVGSFGEGGRGYYALDVTNPGPGKYDATTGLGDDVWKSTTEITRTDVTQGNRVPGPQFLWQLTDMPNVSTGLGSGPNVRTDKAGRTRYSMFGKTSGTPAITTVFVDPSPNGNGANPREIAVAILPGGIDAGPQSGICQRAIDAALLPPPASPKLFDRSDFALARRSFVRKWGANCTDPVAGRSLSVVRLDTGEVLRVFGRPNDVPKQLIVTDRLEATPFDSPMIGVPVVYPAGAGAIGQKVFIGDADGTLWRFDLTSSDIKKWEGSMFLDTQAPAAASTRESGQPILVSPVVSLDDQGRVVVSVSTGEQDSLTPPANANNYVYSITERVNPSALADGLKANLNWYKALVNGERVTGPMVVFDGVHMFATYVPKTSGAVCSSGGSFVYGCEFTTPADPTDRSKGCQLRPFGNPLLLNEPTPGGVLSFGTELIPGVSIRSLTACSSISIDQYASNPAAPVFTPGAYELLIPQATGSSTPSAVQQSQVTRVALPLVRRPARIDSWGHIVD